MGFQNFENCGHTYNLETHPENLWLSVYISDNRSTLEWTGGEKLYPRALTN
jgi:hypothetical protein